MILSVQSMCVANVHGRVVYVRESGAYVLASSQCA